MTNAFHSYLSGRWKKCWVESPSPYLVLLFLLASTLWSYGAGFNLSFLDRGPVLDDTCSLLKSIGVQDDIAKEFKNLVQYHNRSGTRVDLRRFPQPSDGYYQFNGIGDLTNRLSCFFAETPGDYSMEQTTLTCFDTACILLKGAGLSARHLYENFDSKDLINVTEERQVGPVVLNESFRRGVGLLFPPNGYQLLVGRPRTESETQLGLSLRAARRLRSGLTDSDKDLRSAFADYVNLVNRDGFAFPKDFSLGLVFYVDLKRRFIQADHAFICISKAQRLVSLEKNGPRGPFVRAEFTSEQDLALYSSLAERRDTNNPKDVDYGSCVIVTINDRLISIFRPTVNR